MYTDTILLLFLFWCFIIIVVVIIVVIVAVIIVIFLHYYSCPYNMIPQNQVTEIVFIPLEQEYYLAKCNLVA